jgi:trehalose-phosphatase
VNSLAAIAADPERAALFLDLDGVLAPIVERPEDAVVPPETLAELPRLAGKYGLVACVTGRSADIARSLVGGGIRVVGQHGLELEPAASAWAGRIHEFARATGWPDIEVKPLTAAFHYRSASDHAAARVTLEDVAARALDEGFRTKWGRLVLEVVPPIDASKGTAVRALLAESGLRRALYVGDDVTTEGPTELGELADVVVGSTDAVLELLRQL